MINAVSSIVEIDLRMSLLVLGMIIVADLVKGLFLIDTIRVFQMMTSILLLRKTILLLIGNLKKILVHSSIKRKEIHLIFCVGRKIVFII